MKIAAVIAGAIASLVFTSSAPAKILTFNYTARVDQINALVPTGTPITGSFSFDDAVKPITYFPGNHVNAASYQDSSLLISANIFGQLYVGGGHGSVFDAFETDEEDDAFFIGEITGPFVFGVSIWDPGNLWLTDTILPSSFPSPLWQGPFVTPYDDDNLLVSSGEFTFFDSERGQGFNAVILSVTTANTVPELSTWAMMILGFCAIGSGLRRKSRTVSCTRTAFYFWQFAQ